MNTIQFTDKEIQDWIDKCDSDLLYEAQDEFIDPDSISFEALYANYQIKHLSKYGCKLLIQLL
jgi:hypothetical protein